jgi:hypothetical protein
MSTLIPKRISFKKLGLPRKINAQKISSQVGISKYLKNNGKTPIKKRKYFCRKIVLELMNSKNTYMLQKLPFS